MGASYCQAGPCMDAAVLAIVLFERPGFAHSGLPMLLCADHGSAALDILERDTKGEYGRANGRLG